MTDPSLVATDAEEQLRESVSALLRDRCGHRQVLARLDEPDPYDLDTWQRLADLGAVSLLVPEDLGGQGAGPRECAVVCEELGRTVAPVPFLASAVLATSTLLACDTSRVETADLLRSLAAGTTTAVVAVGVGTWAQGPLDPAVRAVDGRLTGRVRDIADASVADVVLVPTDDGLYALDTSDGAVKLHVRPCLDPTRTLSDLECEDTPATRLGRHDETAGVLATGLQTATAMICSEQLGLAQWCFDETVRYVSERIQFGRPVGSFQALKHRLADVWLGVVGARAAAANAADALARGADDAAIAVALAKAHCSNVAVKAAEECLQFHAGIGMTWEHPAHLYLKRAKFDSIALGTPGRQHAALAALVDLPAATARSRAH